ncbi:hypothetical protein B0T26DRAFT_799630 [Lasiosphaeria miniovina]|uniref:Amine oxidase domain-containing protein n=1 Tax=Lasiosphaeria miniovina TaxID=1954250 RepID=A0AA40B4W8_9PEZI|nr:uncharacterized protein B0T26DRAFT_799630 [Lasiosphaeria miniovina]KAK0727692.1 hypothetical protein B0T26DRAFT_799630 [Lasiosphaeria miniovina]
MSDLELHDYDDIPDFEIVEDSGRGKILAATKMKFKEADLVLLLVDGQKHGPFRVSGQQKMVDHFLEVLKEKLGSKVCWSESKGSPSTAESARAAILDDKQDVPNVWLFKQDTPSRDKFETAIADTVKDFLVDDEKNWEQAFATYLAQDDDNYSTRAWLMLKKGFSFQDTVDAEAANTLEGQVVAHQAGMSLIPKTIKQKLLSADWPPADVRGELPATPIKITYNRPVVAMVDKGQAVHVTTTNTAGQDPKTEAYDMVFNTTAMAPLQRMDIEGLELPDNVLTAIRALSYDRATKVVYPSWDDGPDAPAVLKVSYSWAQDVTRMGALMPPYGPNQAQPHMDEPVVSTCLAGLVKLFAGREETRHVTPEFLRSQYVTHHAYAWSHDPLTGGAFALFGPGQFKNVYPQFMHLFAGGKFALSGGRGQHPAELDEKLLYRAIMISDRCTKAGESY